MSETESEDDDDDDAAAAAAAAKDGDDAEDATPHLRRRDSHCGVVDASARLSSSSGLSASLLTSSSDADADSGIDGVSPRLSVAAFGEATLSPSHSILFIDSVSARNSVVVGDGVDSVVMRRQPSTPAPQAAALEASQTDDVTSDDVRPNTDEGKFNLINLNLVVIIINLI